MRYGEMEQRLASAFGVSDPACRVGAFRGRLKHLGRLGLPLGCRPGKGAKVEHSAEHLWQFGLGLELTATGRTPSDAAALVRVHWREWMSVSHLYFVRGGAIGQVEVRYGTPPEGSYARMDLAGLRARLGMAV